jgi:hypothetical protein
MQLDYVWITVTLTALVAGLQWWATRKLHHRKIAGVRARHLKAQENTDKLLQMSRQQTLQLQQELAVARLAMQRPQRESAAPAPAPAVDARSALMKILDEAPSPRHVLPIQGFADTLPSLQFKPSAMGSL